jgi:lysozyme
MPVPGANVVIDISHHQHVTSAIANRIKDAGIVAVIHKATEGRDYRDTTYATRKAIFQDKGFLWGSYHFSSGANPIQQVDNYLTYANPAANELMALDYEPSSSGQNMTLDQMIEFVTLIKQETGRFPVIYGGHLLRQALQGVTTSILSECPLWYARYSQTPIGVPAIWGSWTLWQYSDGNVGPEPHDIPGFGRPDRDTYNGTAAQLQGAWPLS